MLQAVGRDREVHRREGVMGTLVGMPTGDGGLKICQTFPIFLPYTYCVSLGKRKISCKIPAMNLGALNLYPTHMGTQGPVNVIKGDMEKGSVNSGTDTTVGHDVAKDRRYWLVHTQYVAAIFSAGKIGFTYSSTTRTSSALTERTSQKEVTPPWTSG